MIFIFFDWIFQFRCVSIRKVNTNDCIDLTRFVALNTPTPLVSLSRNVMIRSNYGDNFPRRHDWNRQAHFIQSFAQTPEEIQGKNRISIKTFLIFSGGENVLTKLV